MTRRRTSRKGTSRIASTSASSPPTWRASSPSTTLTARRSSGPSACRAWRAPALTPARRSGHTYGSARW
eukprot:4871839-Lingulodinium_polyedra.AAC.1